MAGVTRDIGVRVKLQGADQFSKGMKTINSGLSEMGGWLDITKGILGSQVVTKGLELIRSAFENCTAESIEYESAMANLQKTAGLSETALNDMSNRIMDLSEAIPQSATEIAKLAEEFAHLGLEKDALLPFTETMIALGETTNMSASEAGTALAQLANVMGTSIGDFDRLGSTILYLGKTSATTESQIVDMGQSMAGIGALYGMTEADVLGFAAAMSSIGIESEAGATAIQKFGQKLELLVGAGDLDALQGYADVAGMTAAAFADMWEADPAGAINAFIVGLGQINDAGGSAITALNDLGIKEVRVQKVFASLASAGDLTGRSLDNSAKAWEENAALAEATGIVYTTTASQLQMAQNAITNAEIAIGDGMKGIKLDWEQTKAAAASSIREMIDSDSLRTDMDRIKESYDDTFESISMARAQAEELITAMEALGAVDALDAEGQRKYNAYVQALMEIVPDVKNLYDETTGAVEGGTDALRKMVSAQMDFADAQTRTQMNTEQLEAYTIALENRAALEKELALAESERAAIEKKISDYMASKAGDEFWNPEYDDAYMDLVDASWEATQRVDGLSRAEREATKYLEQYSDIVKETENSTNDLTAATEGLTDTGGTVSEAMQKMIDKLGSYDSELAEAVAAYEEFRKAVTEKISGEIDGLGTISYSGDTDFSELEENMQNRLKFLTEYKENLQKAEEMGYDDEFLQQFTDGSTASAEALAGLVQASDEQVAKMNEDYAAMKKEADELASALATSATGVDETAAQVKTAVESLITGTDVDLSASGAATIQTLIDGMNSKISQLQYKIRTVNALMRQVGSGSDGRNTRVSGGSHAQGLWRVPYDDYPAYLHKNEMILTAAQASAYRAEQYMRSSTAAMLSMRSGVSNNNYETRNQQTVNFGTIVVREEADIQKIAKEIAKLNARNAYGRGVRQ